ncbi:MAG: hypothetical protein QXS48_00110 [Candidatus Aenigmatarchaeota archaeon]
MKQLLIILIILILAVVLVAGYYFGIELEIFRDPGQILFEAIEKSSKIDKYRISYSVGGSIALGSMEVSVNGDATIVKFENKYKTVANVSMPSMFGTGTTSTYSETYILPEGNVKCEKASLITQRYYCVEVEPSTGFSLGESISFSPQAQINLLKEWMEKGIIRVSNLGVKYIINRKCNNLKFDVDLNKLMQNVTGGFTIKEGEASFTIEMCLDKEYGMALETKYNIWIKNLMGNELEFKTNIEATKLSYDVSRSDVELPVPISEVKWLPKLSIMSSECEANSNLVKVTVKAKKDMPTGQALLNITWDEYKVGEGFKTYSLTSSTPFPGARSGETKELSFTLQSPLKESEIYTIKVKIDGIESDTDLCYTWSTSIYSLGSITSYMTRIAEKFRNITKIF